MNRYEAMLAGVRNNCRKGSTHRLLFLDFDGVINVPYAPGTPEFEKAMQGLTNDFFRPEIVARVNRLCRDYGLAAVITSSWRCSGLDYCLDHLYRAGFDKAIALEGMTDTDDPLFRREDEIYRYVRRAGDVSAFLILDDIPMDCYRENEVCTDFEIGYDDTCDARARELLERMLHPGDSLFLRACDMVMAGAAAFLLSGRED